MAIRRAVRGTVAALAAALWACGGGGTNGTDLVFPDPGGADVADAAAVDEAPADSGRDLPGDPDLPGADLPGTDLPPADVPVDGPPADLPGTDAPAAEVPPADAPATDLPASDPGAPDLPPADAGGEVTGPDPWVQCTTDAPCQALFGEYATCNHDFPGGQCMGCNPEAPGVHIQCTKLSRDLDITLSCRMANGGVCLYDCPCPSWLRCLESESLCVLKPCTEDGECGPFQCLEIGDPGSNRYCLPPR